MHHCRQLTGTPGILCPFNVPGRHLLRVTTSLLGFPDNSAGKESACSVGDLGSISGLRRSPGEGNSYPLPVSWPGEFHGLYSLRGRKELETIERLSLSFTSLWSEKAMCLNVSIKTHHAHIASQSQGHMLGKLSLFSPRNTIFDNRKYKKKIFFFNWLQFPFYFTPLGKAA